MRTEQPQNGCAADCGTIANERNRYFTGKFMAARDFQADQDYFLTHHRLHNRLLHGWGIICGLEVKPHPDKEKGLDTECARRWVIVNAGVALDCCGRELALPKMTAFKVHPPTEPTPQHSKQDEASPQNDDAWREPFLLVLRYCEEEIEQVSALAYESGCDTARKQANRVREHAVLDVLPLSLVQNDCWRTPDGELKHADQDSANNDGNKSKRGCHDDCPDSLPGASGSCLDPVCPCAHTVPLALITPTAEGFEIDTRGQKRLPTPPHLLTHIVKINWRHGGEISLSELRDEMQGRLEITFDRRLLASQGEATGVNEHTFVVQYGGVQRDVEFLPFEKDHPPTVEEECRAVFKIEKNYIAETRNSIVDNTVYVTLKCNFILDCHHNPVDGDYLCGLLPSGDGVPGGTFESWFCVVRDDNEEEAKWQQRKA